MHGLNMALHRLWFNFVLNSCGAKLYVPNAVHTALLQGVWLEDHSLSRNMTVLS